jgi:hypothetical protein
MVSVKGKSLHKYNFAFKRFLFPDKSLKLDHFIKFDLIEKFKNYNEVLTINNFKIIEK